MSLDTPEDTTNQWTTLTVVPSSPSSPSSVSIEDEIAENKNLAFRIYKEVWDEFNTWKVGDCEQQLSFLKKPLPPPEITAAAKEMVSSFRTAEPGDVEIVYLCDTEDDDVPLDAGGATVLTCETVLMKPPPDFTPHPRYEFCTPSVQSIAFRVESAACVELETAPFVPYADDPKFDARSYLGQFRWFEWEKLADPDAEVIQFEVLRRLHFRHGLSLVDIDATGILPLLRSTNRFGLIYQMTQRDTLFWSGMMAEVPANTNGPELQRINPRAYEPGIDDLRKRIESIVPVFCANPSCIQSFCPTHTRIFPQVPPAAPRVASNEYPKGSPCENMCFRKIDSAFQEDGVKWEDPDVDELRCILEIIPDTTPCGLAKLVRRPCREVFIQRRRLIPDDNIYPESARKATARRTYRDKNCTDEAYSQPEPCSHTGPCDIDNLGCTCAKESVHCTRNCRCSATCERRYKGCKCRPERKQSCFRGICQCSKWGWECDPILCACKGQKAAHNKRTRRAKSPDDKDYCQNSDIQRGRAAEVEIKRGAYGLGAFAVKRIRQCQFIGEYVGEMIPNVDDKREILRKHVRLNYSFGLNPNYSIDSARVGNETRYINHGKGNKANSHAEKKLVLGDIRIGFYALRDIKAGEEILFDYGEAYWKF